MVGKSVKCITFELLSVLKISYRIGESVRECKNSLTLLFYRGWGKILGSQKILNETFFIESKKLSVYY